LVLDFEIIARIYLDEITMWNDSRIQQLNTPEVAAALPGQPIKVITQSVATGLTSLFTTVLNRTVSDFADQVRASASLAARARCMSAD
jgi:phosphate transport system substrate-binding protein